MTALAVLAVRAFGEGAQMDSDGVSRLTIAPATAEHPRNSESDDGERLRAPSAERPRRRTRWLWRVLAAGLLCSAAAAGLWRGCASDFRRALPLSARDVRTASARVGCETAFHGRADLSEEAFQTVARKLGLSPFREDMPFASHYFMDSHATLDPNDCFPPPPWFSPPTDIRGCWCSYGTADYQVACYHRGTMYFLNYPSLFEDP